MRKNLGGRAFPTHPSLYSSADQAEAQGMSLRDYFAAQALANMRIHESTDNPLYWDRVAKSAYIAADAMLAERAKGGVA